MGRRDCEKQGYCTSLGSSHEGHDVTAWDWAYGSCRTARKSFRFGKVGKAFGVKMKNTFNAMEWKAWRDKNSQGIWGPVCLPSLSVAQYGIRRSGLARDICLEWTPH